MLNWCAVQYTLDYTDVVDSKFCTVYITLYWCTIEYTGSIQHVILVHHPVNCILYWWSIQHTECYTGAVCNVQYIILYHSRKKQ